MYMAKKKKGKAKEVAEPVNVKNRFTNVKVLIDTERTKEAIAYIYLTYNDVVRETFGKARKAHQTIREYAITCVNELNQKPENVYSFVKAIEDIIYGGVEPTQKEINYTASLFSNLYNEITGKTFTFAI